jgi:hypothetical protein
VFVELGVPDPEQTLDPVDIVSVETDGLTDAHAAHRQETDDRLLCCRP